MAGEDEVAAARAVVTLTLSQFKKEMATMGPSAEDAAKDMAKGIQRQLREIEKAAKATAKVTADEAKRAAAEAAKASEKAAAATKKAQEEARLAAEKTAKAADRSFGAISKALMQNQAVSQAETIAAMFITVGGAVSQVAMLVTSAIRPLATLSAMFGPASLLMLGAAAAPALLLGVASAARGLVDGAVEAEDALRKLGLVTNKTASQDLKAYRAAVSDAEVASHELWLAIGEELAPAFTGLVQTGANVLRYFRDLRDAAGQLRHDLELAWRVITAIGSVGMTELARATLASASASDRAAESYKPLIDKVAEATKKAAAYNNILVESQLVFDELDQEYDARLVKLSEEEAALERSREAEQAAAKAKQEHEQRIRDYTAAVLYQRKVETEAAELRAKHHAEYTQALDGLLEDIDKLGGSSLKFQQDIAALLKRNEDAVLQTFEVIRQQAETVVNGIATATGAAFGLIEQLNSNTIAKLQEQVSKQKTQARRAHDEWLQQQQDEIALLVERGELSESNAKKQLALLGLESEARLKAINKIGAAEKAQAMEAFRQNQALQLAQAAIESFRAGISLIPAFAFLGYGAPVAAAAVALAAFTTASAQITSASPPEFPTGRSGGSVSPDHQIVGVRPDEPILSPRAADLLGRDNIDRAQRGQGAAPLELGRATLAALARMLRPRATRSDGVRHYAGVGRRPLYGR